VTEGRALTRSVVLGGEVWEAGSVPPPEVAARIRNPRCWEPAEADPPLPWGPEGVPAVSTATQAVIPAAPAGNGIPNLEEMAGGTVQSGVIPAQPGNVIGRDPSEPFAPAVVTDAVPPVQEPAEAPWSETEPEPEPVVEELDFQPAQPEPPRSGKGATEAAWRAYAESFGVTVPQSADRGDIIARLKDDGYIQ
jgi:hypothetical protein